MGLERIVEGWTVDKNVLVKKITFKDFNEALSFIVRVGIVSEQRNHHPTIENTYNEVCLKLTTHDKGNTITEKDYSLAEEINGLIMTK